MSLECKNTLKVMEKICSNKIPISEQLNLEKAVAF